MAILVTGATGTIGSQLLRNLATQGVAVSALSRNPARAEFPAGVTPVAGDMLDVGAMRQALESISTLFLLNAVTPTELTEALLTLNLAREAGIERFVYFSAFNADRFLDVPHFAAKTVVERMIANTGLPATILRAGCFMQNDALLKDAITELGVYPFPIGGVGVSMVDTRDIADMAALALLERDRAGAVLPAETIILVGPDVLTGEGNAAIWSARLGKSVHYSGDDLTTFERAMSARAPGWKAMDMRLMLCRFQQEGMVAMEGDVEFLTARLQRPLRSYRGLVGELVP